LLPYATRKLYENMPIPNYNNNWLQIINDKELCTRFAAFIDNKISNLWQGIWANPFFSNNNENKKGNYFYEKEGFLTDLSDFFDSGKIIFDNLMPFIATDNYYKVRDFSLDNLAGNLISTRGPKTWLSRKQTDYIVIEKNDSNDLILLDTKEILDILKTKSTPQPYNTVRDPQTEMPIRDKKGKFILSQLPKIAGVKSDEIFEILIQSVEVISISKKC
jgi:hypothetical protein